MDSLSSQSIITILTEDLLIRIFEKLESNSDRRKWRLVCKDFLRVDLLIRTSIRVLRNEFLPSLLTKYNSIKNLDLSVCPRIDDSTMLMLLGRGSPSWTRGLKALILSRVTGLRFPGFTMLIQACDSLEVIDVSYCVGFGDTEASSLSCAPGLRELKMDRCVEVSDIGLAKIAIGCVKLEKLSLKWCLEIGDLGVDLLCKKCLDLKVLDVSYLKITNESLQSIASLTKLEDLAIVGCPLVDDVGLQFLENGCPLLKVIDVSRCECVSSSGIISLIRGHSGLVQLNLGYCFSEIPATLLHWLKNLRNLHTIRVDGAIVSESSFQTISIYCRSLVEIGLSKCLGVSNPGIMKLVSGCAGLRILDLTCCNSITDASMSAIAESCRNIVCLKLESCDMITEKGLYQLTSFCLQLKELDLTDCSGINDEGLKYLSRCSNLLTLKLGLCTDISDKGLCYIGSNCTKIREIDLYRCTGVGDDGLSGLTLGCKQIEKLNLSYCNEVTDRGLKYIGLLEDLSELELRGLVSITGLGLSAVAAGCRRLVDLDLKYCENIDDSGFSALAYYSRNLRQINMSYCAVSDVGLCMIMGNLTGVQNAKLLHLPNVTADGFEFALRACCAWIKKVKLLASFRLLLSPEILQILYAKGCQVKWD